MKDEVLYALNTIPYKRMWNGGISPCILVQDHKLALILSILVVQVQISTRRLLILTGF
jgi:hypothetical protein